MKRNIDLNEISDGKLYTKDDLVKVGCNDCKNCSNCCEVTDDTIHLDPYDIWMLGLATGKNFEELLSSGIVNITVVDGVITPYLCKSPNSECVFLKDKRCSIHTHRPGFCRLFPLGRVYHEDGSFSYIIQIHECPYPLKTKIKVKNWLGIDNIKAYEDYIIKWHNITKSISDAADCAEPEMLKSMNMNLLNKFFITPYKSDNFYQEFNDRLQNS